MKGNNLVFKYILMTLLLQIIFLVYWLIFSLICIGFFMKLMSIYLFIFSLKKVMETKPIVTTITTTTTISEFFNNEISES